MRAPLLLWLLGAALALSSCAQSRATRVSRAGAPSAGELRRGHFHLVRPGETLWRIARQNGVDVKTLARVNNMRDASQLIAGYRLYIPAPRGSEEAAKAPAGEKSGGQEAVDDASKRFRWPVDGVLTSRFGKRRGRRHDGIDIGAPPGTAVYAAAGGEVVYSDNRQRGYGNLIIIDHGQNWVTVYAHNKRNLVAEGERVKAGQRIAEVGATGRAEGPHLHFEVRRRGKPIDPLGHLPD